MDDSDSGCMIKLNPTNFALWKIRMKDYMYCKDLYEPILGEKGKPSDMKDEKWDSMHYKTVANMRKWISQNIFHHFANETRADIMWKKLESMYERKAGINKCTCLKKIIRLRYRDGVDMTEHLATFQGFINQACTLKLNLDDELQALLLISSLPDSWDTIVVSLSNSAPNGTMTLGIVKDVVMERNVEMQLYVVFHKYSQHKV